MSKLLASARTGLLGAAVLFAGSSARAATLTVTGTGDNLANDGACTLREALLNVMAGSNSWSDCSASGPAYGTNDTINFGIGGGVGVKTITMSVNPFPTITKPVTIDGYTQSGASVGTNLASYPAMTGVNAVIMVEIDCGALPNPGTALLVAAGGGGTIIRGLAMGNFYGGALIELQATATIQGNFLGLRADGLSAWSSRSGNGVKLSSGGSSSFIGTLGNGIGSGATRNVISACDWGVYGQAVSGLVIDGNLFGTDKTGTATPLLQTSVGGIFLDSDGTTAPYQPDIRFNLLSGHVGGAIWMKGVYQPTVWNNLIGVGVGGGVIGNSQHGILIMNATPNLVAQKGSYSGNTIAGSGEDGIVVAGDANGSPVSNGLSGNIIYGSGGLGINLHPAGEGISVVTLNDDQDPDTGPDNLQNFPVITSAAVNGAGDVVIQFTLNSTPQGQGFNQFSVTAYSNPACNSHGYGEGQFQRGSTTVTTDTSGNASGTITVNAPLPAGWGAGNVVTLLAHDIFGNNTSEFSQCKVVQAPVAATKLAFIQQPTNAVAGASITPSVTVQLQDAGSSPVLQAGVSVTVALASGLGTLSGTATQVTNASGLATFSGLSVNVIGPKTLSALASGLTGATSSSFVISAGAPASLVILLGNSQHTLVGTPFGALLLVAVEDSLGNPVSGASVSFTPPGSGASAIVKGSPSTTEADGVAGVLVAANGVPGSYDVVASSGTLTPVSFALTNDPAPTETNNVPALGTAGMVLFALALSFVGVLVSRRAG